MNGGDQLVVSLRDTPGGFRVDILDVSTGQHGSMTASVANQFGQVLFEPTSTTCHSQPYAFHPMYGSSSEHTRVPWAAHTYNVSMSDEIGHFEYCDAVNANGGDCTDPVANDPTLVPGDAAYPAASAGWGNTKSGVYGYSQTNHGVVGNSAGTSGVGVLARGGRAPLGIYPSGSEGHPAAGINRSTGDIMVDAFGVLWLCIFGGNPGTWSPMQPGEVGKWPSSEPAGSVAAFGERVVDLLAVRAHRGARFGRSGHREHLAAQRHHVRAHHRALDDLVLAHVVEHLRRVVAGGVGPLGAGIDFRQG